MFSLFSIRILTEVLQFAWLTTTEWWLSGAVAILLFVIWRLTCHQECEYDKEPEEDIKEILPALAGLTHSTAVGGNSATLIRDEDFFTAVADEMDVAQHTIHLETYLWKDGKASDIIAAALCRASQRGVKVRILADARGSGGLSSELRDKIKTAGCRMHFFHPWKIMQLGRFNIRDHRKIIVIDGRVAFVGGHCITDLWLEDQEGTQVYSDVTARLEGPIVHSVQSVFAENWTEVDCDLFTSRGAFPKLSATGEITSHVASLRPDGCPSGVQILHHLAIAVAKKKIRIQNPYFLPDRVAIEALCNAAKRGVDVRIMVPSAEATDSFFVTYAGRICHGVLLEAGVRIFEYKPSLLHQKVITIDGIWAGIGSSNFDDRSFEINDEITVGMLDEKFTGELDDIFDEQEANCSEVELEKWKKRPFISRLGERFFYLFNEQY